jgi:CheY-like chemotaxis protein
MIVSNPVASTSSNFWQYVLVSSQFLPFRGGESELPFTRKNPSQTKSEVHRRALVVDDVSDVTDMLSMLMTHAGYDVSTASSAPAAIELAREHQFDIVISDIGMPEMNGYQLARALRALPAYETVPLVAVTGYSMFDDRTRSLDSGFNEHVTKPIDPRAFLELIEQL